ncbi:MAG: hypothetical protein HC793_01710 [Aquincola sp.]|nr:hypothetical protein [Aquincola sp.]
MDDVLDYTADESGDAKYPGLDPFDRVKRQKWSMYGDGAYTVDDFEYTYDPNSNPLTRKANVTPLEGKDEQYTYDALNRLVDFKRGTLDGGTESHESRGAKSWFRVALTESNDRALLREPVQLDQLQFRSGRPEPPHRFRRLALVHPP